MLTEINKSWNWKEFIAIEVIQINEFGNIIFKTDQNGYWRICPEELSCEKIAASDLELNKLVENSEFIEDWEMTSLVEIAKSELGNLEENQTYCLKIPAVLGGNYNIENFGKISFSELILVSGSLAEQIKDVKDGEEIKLSIKKTTF